MTGCVMRGCVMRVYLGCIGVGGRVGYEGVL